MVTPYLTLLFSRKLLLVGSLVLFLLTFGIFSPALNGDFLNWDDGARVVENRDIREFSFDSVERMFSSFCVSNYTPLERLSCAIDVHVWGLDSWGFHFTNVLLHSFNAVWVFLLAWRLIGLASTVHPAGARLSASALAALAFALHPLRVESVAWVSERRDVLSLFFLLPCVLAWIQSIQVVRKSQAAWGWRLTAYLLFAASLLSKATGVTLPVVLLLLDFWPLRRFRWEGRDFPIVIQCAVEKVPFFVLSLVVGLVAVWGQAQFGGLVHPEYYGFAARAVNAATAIVFYLCQWIFPNALSPLYAMPLHPVRWMDLGTWLPVVWIVLVTIMMWRWRFWHPALFVGWGSFFIMILPLSGLLQSGGAMVADRYTYVSMIPLAMLLGAMVLEIHCRRGIFLMGVVALLGFWTWRTEVQIRVWKDSRTLWERVVQTVPNESLPLNNLGMVLLAEGQPHRALILLREAVHRTPRWETAWFNLGVAAHKSGRNDEALKAFEYSLAMSPDSAAAHVAVGDMLLLKGNAMGAWQHYEMAMRDDPGLVHPMNLALSLAKTGRSEEAKVVLARAALKGNSEAYLLWAEILVRQGQVDHAEELLKLGFRHTQAPTLLARQKELEIKKKTARKLKKP